MVVTQCIYAALALWSKAAFTGGMSPLVFVVYRQAVATVVLVPVVVAANRKKMKEMTTGLGVVGFVLVFVASLVGYANAIANAWKILVATHSRL